LNFKLITGTIGIALIAYSMLGMLPLPVPWMLNAYWVFRWGSQSAMVMCSVSFLLIPTGLMLYIVGRKEFSNQMKDARILVWEDILEFRVSSIITFFGLVLTASSLSFLGWVVHFSPRTSGDWTLFLVLLAWSGLAFMSGVLWLVDGSKMGEVEAPLIKKGIDLESQTKYPRDLLARYMKQYPHNPTGVLEWHIDKKMKEGKTREQAIKELENIGDETI